MAEITIAIASCGRPTLARTLASLDAVNIPKGMTAEVVVADDDPGGAAARVVAATGPRRLPVRCLVVAARNVSAARNACLDAARGDLLAFIDDDEWAGPEWLERMLACKREFAADCVFGPVFPRYPDGTPGWLVRANPLYVEWGRRGREVRTGRSGNALFDIAFARDHALRFDGALGVTGGEDTAFFAAFHRAGGRLVVTDDAPLFEHVPAARLTPAYLRTRSLRSGQSYARIALADGEGTLGRSLFALGALAKMTVAFAAAMLLRPMDRAAALRLRIKGWLNLGKLRDVAGLKMVAPN